MSTKIEPPLLSIRDLRLRPGGVDTPLLFDGFDFDIHPGEVVVLMSGEGQGKSTLLHSLAFPTTGAKYLVRRPEKIGIVTQNVRDMLFPWLTAWRAASLALDIKGVSRKDARKTVLERSRDIGWADIPWDTPVRHLSGGQAQRVAFLQACLFEPHLLLLDEPTSNLNWLTKRPMLEEIRGLASKGLAVLVATHDFPTAIVGDAVCFLGEFPHREATEWFHFTVHMDDLKARTSELAEHISSVLPKEMN